MSGSNQKKPQRIVDRIAESAMPKIDNSTVSQRAAWWWIFLMPGKVMLWIDFVFPRRVSGVFGTARRRNVPLLQLLYSIYFYLFIALFSLGLYFMFHANGASRGI
jgi:hypothetical protein